MSRKFGLAVAVACLIAFSGTLRAEENSVSLREVLCWISGLGCEEWIEVQPEGTSGDEAGPWIIPVGSSTDPEAGPWIVPVGLQSSPPPPPQAEGGPQIIPVG